MKNVIAASRFNEILSNYSTIKPIMVVGDLGIDKYTFGDVKRISPEAPVPVLEVTKEWSKLGLAANISHNLKTMDVASSLCGVVGSDLNSTLFFNLMAESDLDSKSLVKDPSRPTTFKERIVTNTQQICRVDYESKSQVTEDIVDALIKTGIDNAASHSSIILEDYAKGMFSKKLVTRLVDVYKEHGNVITCDPSRTADPMIYEGVTLLKPNQIEAEIMVRALGYNETEVSKMAEVLIEKLKLEKIIITLGKDGMALMDTAEASELTVIPTVATEVFDVSGAGDTAISAITASLVSGASLEEACWIGNCASGVVVAKTGTATVSLDELQEFHSKLLLNL